MREEGAQCFDIVHKPSMQAEERKESSMEMRCQRDRISMGQRNLHRTMKPKSHKMPKAHVALREEEATVILFLGTKLSKMKECSQELELKSHRRIPEGQGPCLTSIGWMPETRRNLC